MNFNDIHYLPLKKILIEIDLLSYSKSFFLQNKYVFDLIFIRQYNFVK
jgi:hypothetical protein